MTSKGFAEHSNIASNNKKARLRGLELFFIKYDEQIASMLELRKEIISAVSFLADSHLWERQVGNRSFAKQYIGVPEPTSPD